MKKRVSATLGFLIAPLFAALALVIIETATKDSTDLTGMLGWALIFYFYTLSVTLIIGLPVYFLLRRSTKITWWSTSLVGIFSGVAMAVVFKPLTLLVIAIGGLSGLVFWAIWRSGEVD